MPVMVPSRPSSGAAVTIVSRTHSQRPSDCSITAASSPARDSTHQAGPRAIVEDHAEEAAEVVACGPSRGHALLEVVPGEIVGLEHRQHSGAVSERAC